MNPEPRTMGRTRLPQAAPALLLLALAAPAAAQTDQVRTRSGSVGGEVTGSTPLQVTVTRGSTEKKVPVNEIIAVQFADEPSELRQARVNVRNGGYETALGKLRGIDAGEIDNPFVKQDIAYYTALCEARRALLGEGSISEAGGKLNRFVQQNRKSYHLLEATEVLGDLFVAAGKFDLAEKRYQVLAKTPWPDYKIRAGVLLGKLAQAQDEHADAIRRFDAVLAIADNSKDAAEARLSARLGRAVSLAATGKLDEGVELVQAVIKESDPESRRLNAAAYNALGGCYRQANKTKDAVFAYLHVDLLYEAVPTEHAEALYYLGSLLDEIGKPQQAREARQTLKRRYASSEWARK